MIEHNALLDWYIKEARKFPWRDNFDPFRILITEVLLRKTTAAQVNKIYQRFIEKYSTPNDIVNEDISILENQLKPLGLYRIRSREMKKMCDTILNEFKGIIPNDYEKLIKLSGVNTYIANCVLCFAFNERVELIDTNITRIYRRLYGDHDANSKKIKMWAMENLPINNIKEFNWALLDLGAKICRARKTLCEICPINKNCIYFNITYNKRIYK